MTLRSVLVSTDNTFKLSLLTVTVTLSLGRPHSSCMDARPEAHVGMEMARAAHHIHHRAEAEVERKKQERWRVRYRTLLLFRLFIK